MNHRHLSVQEPLQAPQPQPLQQQVVLSPQQTGVRTEVIRPPKLTRPRHSVTSLPRPRQAVLYASSRSPSLAATRLEPVYPWDLDDDLDPGSWRSRSASQGRRSSRGSSLRRRPDEDEEEYEHPSLEKSKTLNTFLFLFFFCNFQK